jgi:hypothetical protein
MWSAWAFLEVSFLGHPERSVWAALLATVQMGAFFDKEKQRHNTVIMR